MLIVVVRCPVSVVVVRCLLFGVVVFVVRCLLSVVNRSLFVVRCLCVCGLLIVGCCLSVGVCVCCTLFVVVVFV